MLKFNSRRANLSMLVGSLLLVLIAFIVIKFRPDKIDWLNQDLINNQAATAAQAQSYLAIDQPNLEERDLVFGSAGAPVKIFVFEDYSSPFSAVLADDLDKIRAEFGDRVAVAVRPYTKNSDVARQAAEAIKCAADQNKWKELRALFFAKVKSKQTLDPIAMDNLEQVGIKSPEFALCLTNERKSGKIEQLAAEAETLQVYGAPTIFINDELVPGARPYEDYTDSDGEVVAGLRTLVARKIK